MSQQYFLLSLTAHVVIRKKFDYDPGKSCQFAITCKHVYNKQTQRIFFLPINIFFVKVLHSTLHCNKIYKYSTASWYLFVQCVCVSCLILCSYIQIRQNKRPYMCVVCVYVGAVYASVNMSDSINNQCLLFWSIKLGVSGWLENNLTLYN